MKTVATIKVLIVDDSPLVRSVLSRALSAHEEIEVVGGAKDPFEARELIIAHKPDVILLDVEMPRMDGITFLKRLMAHYPVPVIMCSGVTGTNGVLALEAISHGAVDVVAKPSMGGTAALQRLGEELAEKVCAAAIARRPANSAASASTATATRAPASFRAAGLDPSRYLVAIGASTGGTEAIRQVLMNVPADFPGTAIVQHMPAGFTKSFAERLNQFSPLTVTEASGGEALETGKAFLARGDTQMLVTGSRGRWSLQYGNQEPVNRHCPSVEVLFNSAAAVAGKQAIGIILTGMGADGAKGLLTMRNAGALTIGQDAESCVVYGMPKAAFDMGAVQVQCKPHEVAATLIKALTAQQR